jgi:uncharacterized membrane protein YsdA (DUF1294 family)
MKYHYLPIYALIIALAGSYYLGYTPLIITVIFVIASLFTYFLYAKDKKAAINNTWRTPESSLHLCTLLCGWPGAIIAQQKLRHKTKKVSFRVVFVMTLLINSAVLAGLHTSNGERIVRSFTESLHNFVAINVSNMYVNKAAALLLSFRVKSFGFQQNDNFYIRKSAPQN